MTFADAVDRVVGDAVEEHAQIRLWIPGEECPALLHGLGRCPPEDVGGTRGFEEFLAIMAEPDHPEHEETRTWYGGPFDPDDLDLTRITGNLAAIARRRARPRTRR